MTNKICSSSTIAGLSKLINEYYYSVSWEVRETNNGFEAYNSKLDKTAGKIEYKRNKYTFYL